MRIRSRSSIRRFARMLDSSDKNHAEEDENPSALDLNENRASR
jgi:hypothetical protein